MSAFGGKADSLAHLSECLLIARSGHKWVGRGMSAYDPKRTLVVPDDLQGGILTVLTDLVQTDNPLNFVCDY